jgi:translation initiation factor IF-2
VASRAAEPSAEGEEVVAKPELKLVLKADTLGSLEALEEVLGRFRSDLVGVRVVKRGLGTINDGDVLDAHSAGATAVGFHVTASPSAEELSAVRQVPLLQDDIIYHLLEELEQRLATLVPPEVIRRQLGAIQVLALFRVRGSEQVVGGKVVAGVVKPQTKVKVVRGAVAQGYGDLVTLQSAKEEVAEAAQGTEAGLKVKCDEPIKVGDTLEVFQEEVNRRQLEVKLR